MPFARHSGYSFSPVSVRQNAPSWGGIYGLSNSHGWIFIQGAENIQAALLDHLTELTEASPLRTVTGFTFELCEPNRRADRCSRLIAELHPVVNRRAPSTGQHGL
jgi:hypothetical protein